MSRITYAEEEDFPGQAELWDANRLRSLKGQKGQAALRELEAALLALPSKQLIADELEDAEGNVCAIGALARYKNYGGSLELPEPKNEFEEHVVSDAMIKVAGKLSVPRLVAISIIERNDDACAWKRDDETPEQRYERILGWIRKQILT